MAEPTRPTVYSIAAHRGFADALVAGIVPRYFEDGFGLARLTMLLPSTRAVRTITEAFIRNAGETGRDGLLLPRMVVAGALDLDEALGTLLDPLGAADIPPAADPTRRLLRLAELLRVELGADAPPAPALLRLARDIAAVMDRLLVEDIAPEALLSDTVLDRLENLADHWRGNIRLFAAIQARWLAELDARGEVDAATRRNRLFDHAARRWRAGPPAYPIIAAGVTSAAPALARMLRVVSELPAGAVILPDLDLSLSAEVWDELGSAGAAAEGEAPFATGDAVTHPQYHLKLLLNRMGIAREEVQPWHRRGIAAAAPERSHAISSLFLPPQASKAWVDLPADKRRLAGVRVMESAGPEEEAQAAALLAREALEVPERRVAIVTPDRGLAARIVQHLARWNIAADDSAGIALSQSAAGRLFLLLADIAAQQAAPVPLMALLEHPLVRRGEERARWLQQARRLDLVLRGPRPSPGLGPLGELAEKHKLTTWWDEVASILAPLLEGDALTLGAWIERLTPAGEALAGAELWSREDGRALAMLVDDLRLNAEEGSLAIEPRDLAPILRDFCDAVQVRPPYGGHPRLAIYGLLESRMTRADLVICAGLTEGSWPARPATDPLLAPAILRALGVPGADFRIGLAAHDLAGLLGAPDVVLSYARRDAAGPAIPSRFVLRVRALLGEDLLDKHIEHGAVTLARALDHAEAAQPYQRPEPCPSVEQRKVPVSVTALDRLRSDPYQFYASAILRLNPLDALDAEPTPAWRGIAAHAILERWHKQGGSIEAIADAVLAEASPHPLMLALWRPRLMKALEWATAEVAAQQGRTPAVFEERGEMIVRGVRIHGKVDRIDRLDDGTLAIVDYKTGGPPTGVQVEKGYALQLGTLGLMAEAGAWPKATGTPSKFEYWSLARNAKSPTGFGYIATPVLDGNKRSGIPPDNFLPQARFFLDDALDRWILGEEPFTARLNPDAPGYDTYDQLMRLDEWVFRDTGAKGAGA
ncbi:MAG: double-strand break repair protein AddB [Pelagerythrobacter marensis]|nr:MAG: double-strand break repair protein AddB [Pelagerythrobacter marensis]